MKRLTEDIKNGDFKQVYLIYGEEEYLCTAYRNRLLKAIGAEDDAMNYTKFEGKNFSADELIQTCDTMPFFAERRVVYVENSLFFKEKNDRINEYFNKLPEYLTVVFYEREVDKRGKLYKTVQKYDRVIECCKPAEKDIINWILVELKKNNKQIKKNTLELFMNGAGNDMNFISCELEKVLSYTAGRNEITENDIRSVCSVQTENRIFDMIQDAAAGNRKKALKEYYDLLILKEAPMKILILMERQFDIMLRIKELSDSGLGEKMIAEKLKMHPFAVKKNLPIARKYSSAELEEAVKDLVAAEADVKSGKLSDKLSVELMLIKYSK